MIEGQVYSALSPLVSGRCYPSTFPQEPLPTWPAIRYTIVSADQAPDICGSDVNLATDDTRIQVDVVSKTYGATMTLVDLVVDAMAALATPTTREEGFDVYDAETKTHRAVMEFTAYGST